jgi:hypothetical protein
LQTFHFVSRKTLLGELLSCVYILPNIVVAGFSGAAIGLSGTISPAPLVTEILPLKAHFGSSENKRLFQKKLQKM